MGDLLGEIDVWAKSTQAFRRLVDRLNVNRIRFHELQTMGGSWIQYSVGRIIGR